MSRAVGTAAFVLAGILTISGDARAQAWRDAYQAGRFEEAADLLHAILTRPDNAVQPDGDAARRLSIMYSEGRGVRPDPVVACSLASFSQYAFDIGSGQQPTELATYLRKEEEVHAFAAQQCAALSAERRVTALRIMGCFAFGFTDGTFEMNGRQVVVTREAIAVGSGARARIPLTCIPHVARVRKLTIDPPANAPPGVMPRNFVEILGWAPAEKPDGIVRQLWWQLFEILQDEIVMVAPEVLAEVRDTAWPRPALAADFDERLRFEMLRSGHIRWRFVSAPARRGWLMLPEERSGR